MAWPQTTETLPANKTNTSPMANDHPAHHNDLARLVNAITFTLGVDPAGPFTDVAERLTDIEAGGGGGGGGGLPASAGTANAPSISFSTDLDTGFFRAAADSIGVATGAVERHRFTTTGLVHNASPTEMFVGSVTPYQIKDPASAQPIFRIASLGQLQWGTGGSSATDIALQRGAAGALETTGSFRTPLGSAAAPALTFTGDTDTGIYSPGADSLAFAVGGKSRMAINSLSGIELGVSGNDPGAQSPWIDFHYAPAGTFTGQDFNVRVQNDADRQFTMDFPGNAFTRFQDGALDINNNTASTMARHWGARVWNVLDDTSMAAHDFQVGYHFQTQYKVTPSSGPFADGRGGWHVALHGVDSSIVIGTAGTPAYGTVEAFDAYMRVEDLNDVQSEQGLYVGFLNYAESTRAGSHGRAWLTDLNLHTRIGRQMAGIPGASIFANKYDNAAPSQGNGSSSAMSIGCGQGGGGGGSTAHSNATTYAMQSAIHIYGTSGVLGASAAAKTNGWTRAIQIGNQGANSHLWDQATKVGTGVWITDYTDRAVHIHSPATGATAPFALVADANAGMIVANGGLSIPSINGIPSDTSPINYGANARNGLMCVSNDGDLLWVRIAGTWRAFAHT
jgi:hypothetical protein